MALKEEKQKDKLMKDEDTENKKKSEEKYSAYCPVIDQVVKAKNKKDREKKVRKIIKEQGK